jgi:DNA-directed RNA polymerase specialized sigma subunit
MTTNSSYSTTAEKDELRKQAIELYYNTDMSYKDIGERLKVS